jgi:hypothetical protein
MNPAQRYVLASSRVLVALILLLNVLGIIRQAQAAREAITSASLAVKRSSTTEKREGSSRIPCVSISGVHPGWKMRRP